MLAKFPGVRRWEQTGDVLQGALVRLHRALGEVQIESVQHFHNLIVASFDGAMQRRPTMRIARRYIGSPQ